VNGVIVRILLGFCFLFLLWSDASAKRIAFLMGVDTYTYLNPLKKAVGDVRAMKTLLQSQSDVVIGGYLENATREEFWKAWDRFLAQIQENDEVFVHISSHGLEIDGVNYLLPKDAPSPERGQRMIQQEGIRFSDLESDLSNKNPRLTVFVLDACRDNPYRAKGVRGVGGDKGLAQISPPEGFFVLYSAGANQTALDRLNDNDPVETSVYMRNLLPLLSTPGLTILDVAVQVRTAVYELAATVPHKQSPTYYDNLIGRGKYCFAGCEATKAASAQELPPVTKPAVDTSNAVLAPPPRPTNQQYLDRAQRLLRLFSGHSGAVSAVAFSRDGKLAASGSRDRTVKIWEIATGRELTSFAGHSGAILSLQFSPDDKRLLSGSEDRSVRLWDLESGRELLTLSGHGNYVNSVTFSPDGTVAASGGDDNTVKVWSLSDGRLLQTLTGHTNSVVSVAIASDGKSVFSGSWDNTIRMWNIEAGKETQVIKSNGKPFFAVALSNDQQVAITASRGIPFKVWDTAQKREVRTLPGHINSVTSLALTPDKRFLVSAGCASTSNGICAKGSLKLINVAGANLVAEPVGATGDILAIAFSPDGQTVLSGSADKNVRVWDFSEWTRSQETRSR
jgi:WD40 repeat protein